MHRKEWFYATYPLLKAHGCTECEKFLDCNKAIELTCKKIQCDKEQAKDVITASLPCLSWDELPEGTDKYPCLIYTDDEIIENVEARFRSEKAWKMLECLTERQKEIIIDRYGLRDGTEKTLEQVGQKYGVTRERIRQIESKALRKLMARFVRNREKRAE